jgi:cytochrome b561
MQSPSRQTYSTTARFLHWSTVAALAVLFPLGITMNLRGNGLNIWDATTDAMYSTHKLLGVVAFAIVAARLCYRLARGAPADEPTLRPWHNLASHTTHWLLYALLLIVPLVGWFGVQLLPALDLSGLLTLPAVIPPDKAASGPVMRVHHILAFVLLFLAAMHVGAALYHHFIRKDQVLNRMIGR